MSFSAPWTEIGRCQSDINTLQQQLRGKVDDWELRTVKESISRLDREISDLEDLYHRLEVRISMIEQKLQENEEKE